MSKKKLTYIANIRMPTEKAHGVQIINMCRAFADLGYAVELLVSDRPTAITLDVDKYYGVSLENITITKLRTLDLVAYGKVGFWVQAMSFAWQARRHVTKNRSDVIYSRDEYSLFLLPKEYALVYEVHARRVNWLLRKVWQKVSKVVVITKFLKDWLGDEGVSMDKIFVAHDGVVPQKFEVPGIASEAIRNELGIPLDVPVVGYIGKTHTMGMSKGIEDMVIAFANMRKKITKAVLLIVGVDDEFKEGVEKICLDNNLETDAYRIVGHVPPVTVPAYMSAATVLLMYYPNNDHYKYYMSPLKLFEYMAMGKPIVASRLPSVEEVLVDDFSARLVEPENPEALSDALIEVLSDGTVSWRLGNAARSEVQKYTWERRAQLIVEHIES